MEINNKTAFERIQGAPISLYRDPITGTIYAFCSKQCYRRWVVSENEHSPDLVEEKWGCWWCGKCVHPGGENALDKPENRIF